MISDVKKRAAAPWLPMAFCAFLSLITMSSSIWLSFVNGSDAGGSWAMPFLGFLPMCFYFMAVPVARLQGEVSDLRKQLAEFAVDK